MPGKPDLFVPPNTCLFVDGSFWHGKNGTKRLDEFWRDKIGANVARDGRVNAELESLGYRVVRVWDSEIEAASKALDIKAKKPIYKRKTKGYN